MLTQHSLTSLTSSMLVRQIYLKGYCDFELSFKVKSHLSKTKVGFWMNIRIFPVRPKIKSRWPAWNFKLSMLDC